MGKKNKGNFPMRRALPFIALSAYALCAPLFSQQSETEQSKTEQSPTERVSLTATKRFITGSIAEKTRAVTEATGEESYALSREALTYVKAYCKILGDDKGLSALAVAGVLSLKADSIRMCDDVEKAALVKDICDVYTQYKGVSAVRAAILNRMVSLKDELPLQGFVALLNAEIETDEQAEQSEAEQSETVVNKEVVGALSVIGDGRSFVLLWEASSSEDEASEVAGIEEALESLLCTASGALPAALEIAVDGDDEDCERMLCLIERSGAKDSIKGEVAEAVLKNAVLQKSDAAHALIILKELRWTRSAANVFSYLVMQKDEWSSGGGSEDEMTEAIDAAAVLSPIDSGKVISKILVDEVDGAQGQPMSEKVISSCINALRTIGDKGAFDSLLAVVNAPSVSDVLKARANNALSALKW